MATTRTTTAAGTTASTSDTSSSDSRVAGAYQSARDKAGSAFSSTTRAVGSAGRSVGSNPVSALVGGFAVGALVGAVIPASRREREALQPLGSKINETARTAAQNAAKTGRDKINQMTGEMVNSVGSKVVEAVAPKEQ